MVAFLGHLVVAGARSEVGLQVLAVGRKLVAEAGGGLGASVCGAREGWDGWMDGCVGIQEGCTDSGMGCHHYVLLVWVASLT